MNALNARERMVAWLFENNLKTWEEAVKQAAREYLRAAHCGTSEEAKTWDMRVRFFLRMYDEKRRFPIT